MAITKIPEHEIRAFETQRILATTGSDIASRVNHDAAAAQFVCDFREIAHAITDQARQTTPARAKNARRAPLHRYTGQHHLPFGPLMRMARLIGVTALRHIFAVGSPKGFDFHRLVLRPRLDNEFQRGNAYKEQDFHTTLIMFGNTVLHLERDIEKTRSEALQEAARQHGLAAAAARSHERYFRRFRQLCERQGYVPSPLEWLGEPPRFSLADLPARTSDKQKE